MKRSHYVDDIRVLHENKRPLQVFNQSDNVRFEIELIGGGGDDIVLTDAPETGILFIDEQPLSVEVADTPDTLTAVFIEFLDSLFIFTHPAQGFVSPLDIHPGDHPFIIDTSLQGGFIAKNTGEPKTQQFEIELVDQAYEVKKSAILAKHLKHGEEKAFDFNIDSSASTGLHRLRIRTRDILAAGSEEVTITTKDDEDITTKDEKKIITERIIAPGFLITTKSGEQLTTKSGEELETKQEAEIAVLVGEWVYSKSFYISGVPADVEVTGIQDISDGEAGTVINPVINYSNTGGEGEVTILWQIKNSGDNVVDSDSISVLFPSGSGTKQIPGIYYPAQGDDYTLEIKESDDSSYEVSNAFDTYTVTPPPPTNIGVTFVTAEAGVNYVRDLISCDISVFNNGGEGSATIEWRVIDVELENIYDTGTIGTGTVGENSGKSVEVTGIETPSIIGVYFIQARIQGSGDAWMSSSMLTWGEPLVVTNIAPASSQYDPGAQILTDITVLNRSDLSTTGMLEWQVVNLVNALQSSGTRPVTTIAAGQSEVFQETYIYAPVNSGDYRIRVRIEDSGADWKYSDIIAVRLMPDVYVSEVGHVDNGQEGSLITVGFNYNNTGGEGDVTFQWQIKNSGGSVIDSGSEEMTLPAEPGTRYLSNILYPSEGSGYTIEIKEENQSEWKSSNSFNTWPDETDLAVTIVTPESGYLYTDDNIDCDITVYNTGALGSGIIEWRVIDAALENVYDTGTKDTGLVGSFNTKVIAVNGIETPSLEGSYFIQARIQGSGDAWISSSLITLQEPLLVTDVIPASYQYDVNTQMPTSISVYNRASLSQAETIEWQVVNLSYSVQSSGTIPTPDISGGSTEIVNVPNIYSPANNGSYKIRARIQGASQTWTYSDTITIAEYPKVEVTELSIIDDGQSGSPITVTFNYNNTGGAGNATIYWRVKDKFGTIVSSGSSVIAFPAEPGTAPLSGIVYPVAGIDYILEVKETDDSSWEASNKFETWPNYPDMSVISVLPQSEDKYADDNISCEVGLFNFGAEGTQTLEWQVVNLSDNILKSGSQSTGVIPSRIVKSVDINVLLPTAIGTYKVRARILNSGDAWVYSTAFTTKEPLIVTQVNPTAYEFDEGSQMKTNFFIQNRAVNSRVGILEWEVVDLSDNIQSNGIMPFTSISGGQTSYFQCNAIYAPETGGTFRIRGRVQGTTDAWVYSSNILVIASPDVDVTGIDTIMDGMAGMPIYPLFFYSNSGGAGKALISWTIRNSSDIIIYQGSEEVDIVAGSGATTLNYPEYPSAGTGYYMTIKEASDVSYETSNSFDTTEQI